MKQVVVITKLKRKDIRAKTRHIHHQTLASVLKFLDSLSIKYRVMDRSLLTRAIQVDLILTVGGDGTALAASHFAGHSPLFCINSAPATSTGFFCRAKPDTFRRELKQILTGRRHPVQIPRLAVYLNGRKLKPYGLNDVLVASKLQGETTRYRIQIGGRKGRCSKEEHKSSGVWIATGAGSTAAIHSAGGKKDSPFSKRLQYKVREPCRFPKNHYGLLGGFVKTGETIKIVSEIRQGMVFIDGAKWRYPIPKHGILTVRGGVAPVNIYL